GGAGGEGEPVHAAQQGGEARRPVRAVELPVVPVECIRLHDPVPPAEGRVGPHRDRRRPALELLPLLAEHGQPPRVDAIGGGGGGGGRPEGGGGGAERPPPPGPPHAPALPPPPPPPTPRAPPPRPRPRPGRRSSAGGGGGGSGPRRHRATACPRR